jgi:hypothetical protein
MSLCTGVTEYVNFPVKQEAAVLKSVAVILRSHVDWPICTFFSIYSSLSCDVCVETFTIYRTGLGLRKPY